MKVSAAETLELPIPERIQLVTEIWDSIAAVPEKIELTPSTRKLLVNRLEEFRSNPESGSPWIEVRNRIASE